jgi:hypothetical protein
MRTLYYGRGQKNNVSHNKRYFATVLYACKFISAYTENDLFSEYIFPCFVLVGFGVSHKMAAHAGTRCNSTSIGCRCSCHAHKESKFVIRMPIAIFKVARMVIDVVS